MKPVLSMLYALLTKKLRIRQIPFFLFLIPLLSLVTSCKKDPEQLSGEDVINWLQGRQELEEQVVLTWFSKNPSPVINQDTAYFVYHGEAERVEVSGDFNNYSPEKDPMVKAFPNNWWMLGKSFDPKARLEYKVVVNSKNWILDPLNNRTMVNDFGGNSVLEMPRYLGAWEINSTPANSFFERSEHTIASKALDTLFKVVVLIPKGRSETSRFPTVYFQDGDSYLNFGMAERAFTNLIDSGLIQPFIGIFVQPMDRSLLFAGQKRFDYGIFFAKELVSWADQSLPTIPERSSRIVIGNSYGGNISAFIAYYYPEVFSACALHSPAFIANDFEVYKLFKENEKKDLKVTLIWGSYESLGSIHSNLQEFVQALKDRGYPFHYSIYPEGHTYGLWRTTYDDLLVPLLSPEEKEIP